MTPAETSSSLGTGWHACVRSRDSGSRGAVHVRDRGEQEPRLVRVITGALLSVLGLVILGNVATATKVLVMFLGWVLLLAGIVEMVSAVANRSSGRFWSPAIAGAFSFAVGLMFPRHTEAAALTLTLIAGSLFLTTGLVRLAAAGADAENRWPLLLSGAGATVLGLIVLFNVFEASYALIGALLGIQTLVEGLSIMLLGRVTLRRQDTDEPLVVA
jgi:uncharacterized membrane protein HdeD (DUF308 family)